MSHLSIGKVVCVGRNYVAHAKELGNDVPESPMLFLKPASSVTYLSDDKNVSATFLDVPRNQSYDVHYETELCLQLGQDLVNADVQTVQQAMHNGLIAGVTVGLDLTLRDLQSELKAKGHPWERAKCFAGSCVLADWMDATQIDDFASVRYQLLINDTLTQDGDTGLMIFDIPHLLSDASFAFGLQAGDVIMTGTPSGVGKLEAGDTLSLILGDKAWGIEVK